MKACLGKYRPSLEERLEIIISRAALMVDSSCTRDERMERIAAECNAVRQALQDLLNDYMANAGEKASPKLEAAINNMCRKTRDLRRQLRKAVVDHVSNSFLESGISLTILAEAAKTGREKEAGEGGERPHWRGPGEGQGVVSLHNIDFLANVRWNLLKNLVGQAFGV